MTDDASPAGSAHHRAVSSNALDRGPHARFELLPAGEDGPVTVRAAGDIDLTNVGQFQAALDQAAAASHAVTADMTAVTYCDSAAIRALFSAARRGRLTIQVAAAGAITGTLLQVSGLDQIATVVTLSLRR
jgi:anti-sigma B factor antagonist